MIRFILKRRFDNSYGATTETFETIDLDVPLLESALKRGGMNRGGPGYDLTDLVGAEVIESRSSTRSTPARPGRPRRVRSLLPEEKVVNHESLAQEIGRYLSSVVSVTPGARRLLERAVDALRTVPTAEREWTLAIRESTK